jgi:hypothetical protein
LATSRRPKRPSAGPNGPKPFSAATTWIAPQPAPFVDARVVTDSVVDGTTRKSGTGTVAQFTVWISRATPTERRCIDHSGSE